MIARAPMATAQPAPTHVPASVDLGMMLERNGVELADEEAIRGYFDKYPQLASKLEEAIRLARVEFPEPNALVMRYYRDPEFPDEYPKLCARVTSDPRELMDRVLRVADLHHALFNDAEGMLLFTLDFGPGG